MPRMLGYSVPDIPKQKSSFHDTYMVLKETCTENVGGNVEISWVKSTHSYLHLSSIISAPRQEFKILTYQFHCIHFINHHAKFQPPSFSSLGGDSCEERMKF